jgi:hypothetical protein
MPGEGVGGHALVIAGYTVGVIEDSRSFAGFAISRMIRNRFFPIHLHD